MEYGLAIIIRDRLIIAIRRFYYLRDVFDLTWAIMYNPSSGEELWFTRSSDGSPLVTPNTSSVSTHTHWSQTDVCECTLVCVFSILGTAWFIWIVSVL